MPKIEAGTVAEHRAMREQQVLQAAADLLVDGGPQALTPAAVAKRAKISRTAVYHYYPSSADLLIGALEHLMEIAVTEIDDAVAASDPAPMATSVTAADTRTGKVLWSYQIVAHDIWDYDIGAAPTLVDLTIGGEVVPALVQTTKMGMLFVLNRVTGEPIFPVEDRPVSQTGAVAGEVFAFYSAQLKAAGWKARTDTQDGPLRVVTYSLKDLNGREALGTLGIRPWEKEGGGYVLTVSVQGFKP